MVERLAQGAQEARDRRDRLAEATEALGKGLAIQAGADWRSRRVSQCRADQRAPVVMLGARTEEHFRIIRYEARVNLRSVADQLDGFAVLLRAERSLMGAVSVARGVFEASLWAAALLDPTLTPDGRLQRALARRLARLEAGIRLDDKLTGRQPAVDDSRGADTGPECGDDDDDEHGGYRDPQQDITDIVAYARSRGWKVKKGQRAWEIEGRLSIDWLTENLEQRIGLEGYAWTSGSSMAHGEHAADTASWMELAIDTEIAPAWLMRLWSTGVWAGPRLLLTTYAKYTDRPVLVPEFKRFNEAFWDVGIKN